MSTQKYRSRRVPPTEEQRCADRESKSRSNSSFGAFRRRWKTVAAGCGLVSVVVSFLCVQVVVRSWKLAQFELDSVKQNLNRESVDRSEDFAVLYKAICWDEDLYQVGLDALKESELRRALTFFEEFVATQDPSNRLYVANAYHSLGLIHGRLHEFERAEAALQTARLLLSSMDTTATDSESVALKASVATRLAWLLANVGKLPEAEVAALDAVQLLTARNRLLPGDGRILFELAIASRNLGLIRLLRGEDGSGEIAAAIQAGERMLGIHPPEVEKLDFKEAAACLQDISMVIDCCQLQMALLWRKGDLEQAAQIGSRSVELCESQLECIRKWSRLGYVVPAHRYRNAMELARENLTAISSLAASGPAAEPRTSAPGALPDEWRWKSLYLRHGTVIDNSVLARGRLAGEFEQQDGLAISWGDAEWCDTVMPQIAKHVHDRLQLIVLISDSRVEQSVKDALADAGVVLDNVSLHYLPIDTVWIRDYGPLALTTATGQPKFVEAIYGGTRYRDEDLPSRFSEIFNVPLIRACFWIDWGGILSNGAGVCLVSTAMLRRNEAQGISEAQVTAVLQRLTGADRIVYLDPLNEEKTGHIDVFATFTSANTIVIGDCHSSDPANADLLDRHAARLQGMPTSAGELQVVRIPMPPRGKGYFGGSYTNVIYANGVLLVPSWPNAAAELEAEALAVYRRLLPDWKIVTLDASEFGYRDGGLHCATMNIHRLPRGKLKSLDSSLGRRTEPSVSDLDYTLTTFIASDLAQRSTETR